MQVTGVLHIAIKTGKPEATKHFYEQVLGMSEAPRPAFEFSGYWMQLNTAPGGAIFHIYTGEAALGKDGRAPVGTGAVDHISLAAHGFDEMRERCKRLGVPYRERIVPGFPLWQIFFYDPNGIQFELQFHSACEGRPGVSVDPNNWLKAGIDWFDPETYRQFETA
jgi:catechol 2,3-dioxygenase-like lactoylglutathione lyase family enzyme